MRRRCAVATLMALAGVLALAPATAQPLRDPTLPPAETGLRASPLPSKPPDFEPQAFSVIVRDGRRYLVHGTRLYGQGQRIGATRIERISETEVWLREDGVLRKLPLFPGIQLRRLPSAETLPPRTSFAHIVRAPIADCPLVHARCSSQEREKSPP